MLHRYDAVGPLEFAGLFDPIKRNNLIDELLGVRFVCLVAEEKERRKGVRMII